MTRPRFESTAAAAAALAIAALAGCASHEKPPPAPEPEDGARADRQVIDGVRDAGVANAILTQHTLYPYHFVANGRDLNELGQRDLSVLAEYYRANPGELSVRRGDAPSALYDARVAYVQDALTRAGVDAARVTIGGRAAAGPGLPAEDVVRVLDQSRHATVYGESSGSGSSSSAAAGAAGAASGSTSGAGGSR